MPWCDTREIAEFDHLIPKIDYMKNWIWSNAMGETAIISKSILIYYQRRSRQQWQKKHTHTGSPDSNVSQLVAVQHIHSMFEFASV